MPPMFAKIGQNTGILLLVNILGSLIGFLMAAALGRGLGDAGFGQYSFVMTWLFSLILFTEFGLSTVLTRDLAAHPEQTHSYLVNSLAGKSLLSLPAILALLFLSPHMAAGQNPAVIAGLRWGVLFLYSSLISSSFTAIFRAHQVMTPILWLTLSGQVVLFAGAILLLWGRQPLFTLIAWTGVSQSWQCILALIFYKKLNRHDNVGQVANLSPTGNGQDSILSYKSIFRGGLQHLQGSMVKQLIIRAWPFALAGFLAALQLRANVLLLAYLQGDQALGWYAAANRFVETGKQLPGAFFSAMLPAMAALAGASREQNQTLQKTLHQSRLGMLMFGLLAALGALWLAQPIITLTYGSAYQPATATLQILSFTLIPFGQNSLLIIYLYARGDEKFVNGLTLIGIVINLSLCFWLIPGWGAGGTALALLIAESLLYFPYRQRAKQQLDLRANRI